MYKNVKGKTESYEIISDNHFLLISYVLSKSYTGNISYVTHTIKVTKKKRAESIILD